ncbi:unnamed protein product [Brassicogethes aeneus]|uniref:Protein downstream neighbor of son homolog n=1 Tax=Brassicogethes aeneus TaxID=1431903 RepID=A0A9P0B4P9_BRAAE|nr:unnamed protein product [Brassicogethes aeneus]
MPESPEKTAPKWHHPAEVMKLHKLKQKKKQLQARIAGNVTKTPDVKTKEAFEDVFCARKRKNPFLSGGENKKNRIEPTAVLEESADQTLFKLLNQNAPNNITTESFTSFNNILDKINAKEKEENVEIVKAQGESWLPIDWGLKSKARLLSEKPFPWNQKLKISEEASGVTGFTRCLDTNCETQLDTSPNARFHQCCLFWQQPSLPWVNLFPRTVPRASAAGASLACNSVIRDSLQAAWSDSLRSLFQLIRTRQCPYFYACANSFTVLFRAAGICGHSEVHALVTPTTRGFRYMLKQEDIEFTMPLKKKRTSDVGYETQDSEESVKNIDEEEEATPDEQWMKSMGINAEDIKQINYTQAKILHKTECEVDNSDQSLILIEGVEVHAFYNFLINCKSTTATTGPLAGIPPTLLAPVAYHGATLTSLKVRENKVHVDDADYYSLDLSGPILPSTIHNLFAINPPEHSITISFNNIASTNSFSKLSLDDTENKLPEGNAVFIKENLADCGLNDKVLEHFAKPDNKHITNVDCIKYISDNKTYTWT